MGNEQYGLPMLGQVQSFLRDILGDDLLYEIASVKMNNHEIPTIDKDSCRKKWDRYCKEEMKDYLHYILYSHESMFSLWGTFIEKLKKDYLIDENCLYISDVIYNFASSFYQSLKRFSPNELSIPAGCKTQYFVFLKVVQAIFSIEKISEKKDIKTIKNLLTIMNNNFTYQSLFEELKTELNCSSLEKMYEKLFDYEIAKKNISKSKKSDLSPPWNFLEKIIKECSPELKQKFILKYLLKNSIESAKKNFDLTDDDFNFIKDKLNQYCNSNNTPDVFFENSLEYFHQKKVNPFYGKKEPGIIFELSKIAFNKISEDIIDLFLEKMKKDIPHVAPFFYPYFKALFYLTHRSFSKLKDEDVNLLNAEMCFNEAFEHKYLAGDYLKDFLIRGFVLTNYLDANYTTVIKSNNKDSGQINPTSCNSKKFLNFGKVIDLFPDSSEFAHSKVLDSIDLFQKYFPPDFFSNKEDAQLYYENEFKNKYEIEFEIPNDNIESYIKEQLYDKLKNLKTYKQRNTLIFLKDAISEDNSHNSKQKQLFPPLSLCFKYSLNDERLLDLAKEWIQDADNLLEISKVSFEGETPLCELLKIYKYTRIHFVNLNDLKQKLPPTIDNAEDILNSVLKKFNLTEVVQKNIKIILKLEEIINLLIDKIDYESELQFGNCIPTLKYAIDSFNFDFVKKLVDKIPEKEFQNYKIENPISPLMYAIERKQPVSLEIEEYIRLQKDINLPHKIRKNPCHFTREQIYKEYKDSNPRPEGINEYWYHRNQKEKNITEENEIWFYENYGYFRHLWKQQIEELDKIIDLLISRTDNVDYIKDYTRTSDNEHLFSTALVFAGQHNDIDTCKKLLIRGAEPFNEEFGFYSMKYEDSTYQVKNNLIYNLIAYNSWETLIMIFDDYPEIINESLKNDENNINSLTVFAVTIINRFIWSGKEKQEYRPIAEYIINRFIEFGADPDLETIIGTARKLLSGTKLLDNY